MDMTAAKNLKARSATLVVAANGRKPLTSYPGDDQHTLSSENQESLRTSDPRKSLAGNKRHKNRPNISPTTMFCVYSKQRTKTELHRTYTGSFIILAQHEKTSLFQTGILIHLQDET